MSYESIASSVFTNLRSRLREIPSRLTAPVRRAFGRRKEETDTTTESTIPAGIREKAAADLDDFVLRNEPLFDRMDRWDERVRRLREDGNPSESAARRAERAREETLEGVERVRHNFVSRNGKDGARAFEAELRSRYPGLFEDRPN